ncbi:hypothetical protein B0H14DRAFT_3488762 [Mycena olivaceomarginata]|nr:hypothetical protein B0H14DRAFT_3488762 [Mycena olivaceomarginata]
MTGNTRSLWSRWAGIFPGARIAPAAIHSHLQVDGILFSDVGDIKDLKREFEMKNPDLGKVVGLPTWVNRPPSESQIAAIIASGRKPKVAGSIYFLLESKAKVDLALSRGRILLCSFSPVVSRGFPHLRVSQCWKCYRYGHRKARCNVKQPCCPTCAQPPSASHSSPCNGPVRKELALSLVARQRELQASLDKTSAFPLPYIRPIS